ncbi:hypothetical protein AAE02nite_26400 [Adhaeribacter aerolatus]|uniref:Bacteriocin-protection protein n=1 Tax=Adhaeribacter aerolatus TaxID=670289 RepID=A0A512AZ58_9BACT|nr:hypothetical protein [Adhaeribacter aerolatus]GEO04976.1 hypothetical protein AAE02nite_26400 [Adhaeribacter aerolatus]
MNIDKECYDEKMEIKAEKEVETICPANRQEWRLWLKENHRTKKSVWLIYFKKKSGYFTISWSEAVEEALCFGWIDSKAKPLDAERFMQFFCQRKPTSVWSKINKEKIQRLSDAGLITPAGYDSIQIAKQNGSWTILDEVEELIIPETWKKLFKHTLAQRTIF